MVIFVLLPESNPVNLWMNNNHKFQDEVAIQSLINQLEIQYRLLNIEDYEGYFDSKNIQNFLADFEITADYYPKPKFHLIRKYLSAFNDFRINAIEQQNENYSIYNQTIKNHTFSEIAERQLQTEDEAVMLISYNAHNLGDNFEIVKNTEVVSIKSITNYKKLHQWLAINRSRTRHFQIIKKHGENRSQSIVWSGEDASPLKCSETQAKALLQTALGFTKKELFAYDENNEAYIVFKYEGNNPQNRYHGYHIPVNSSEIDHKIKKLINQLT